MALPSYEELANAPNENLPSYDKIVSYSPDNPPPAEIKPGTGTKAENVIASMDQAPTYPSKADADPTIEAITRPIASVEKTAAGFVTGLPQMIADTAKFSHGTLSEKLETALRGGLGVAGQMQELKTAPAFSQRWWDALVPLAAQEAGAVAGVRSSGLQAKLSPVMGEVPKVEAPPIQAAELPAKVQENVQAEVPIEAEKAAGVETAASPAEILTPRQQELQSEQDRRIQWERKNESDRTQKTINDMAQKIYDQALVEASGVGPKDIQVEQNLAEQKHLIPLAAGADRTVSLAYDRAHEMATQVAEGNHGSLLPENRLSKYVDYEKSSRDILESLPKTAPVPEVSQAPVESGLQAKPELPNTEVTIKASTSKGEPLEVKMDAREAEKMLNERKTALENLIDCLGA